jgi:hypothetical protein
MSKHVHITDGGHAAAKMRGTGRNACVPRAIAIALGLDYRETHDALEAAQQEWATTGRTSKAKRRAEGKTIAQEGVHKAVYTDFLAERGWQHISLMSVGQQRERNPRFADLPTTGTIIANVSKHLSAVIDGVIHDTHDPTRGGTRTVYGYWKKGCDA